MIEPAHGAEQKTTHRQNTRIPSQTYFFDAADDSEDKDRSQRNQDTIPQVLDFDKQSSKKSVDINSVEHFISFDYMSPQIKDPQVYNSNQCDELEGTATFAPQSLLQHATRNEKVKSNLLQEPSTLQTTS